MSQANPIGKRITRSASGNPKPAEKVKNFGNRGAVSRYLGNVTPYEHLTKAFVSRYNKTSRKPRVDGSKSLVWKRGTRPFSTRAQKGDSEVEGAQGTFPLHNLDITMDPSTGELHVWVDGHYYCLSNPTPVSGTFTPATFEDF